MQATRRHPSLLGLAALAALGLAAAHPAQAQTAYYTNGTFTIDSSHSVNGSAKVGEDSSGNYSDSNGPYSPTVNLVSGGSVSDDLYAYNSSHVNLSGGSVDTSLYASDYSRVSMSGGSVGSYLDALDDSHVNLSGGSVSNELIALGSSYLNLSGGSVNSYLYAGYSSRVTVSGGTVGTDTVGTDRGVNYFDSTTGTFTFLGQDLTASTGVADSKAGGADYTLTGDLLDGTDVTGYVVNVQSYSPGFTIQNDATPAPEPSSVAAFAFTGLGALALMLRARKSRRA